MSCSRSFLAVLAGSCVAMCVVAGCAGSRRDRAIFVGAASPGHDAKADSASARPLLAGPFRPDLSRLDRPDSLARFHQVWHGPCVSQESTGECWAYAATSFMESEAYRLNGRKLSLSTSWTVYWEYVECARRFVRKHGDLYFANGSEPNAIPRIWRDTASSPPAPIAAWPPDTTITTTAPCARTCSPASSRSRRAANGTSPKPWRPSAPFSTATWAPRPKRCKWTAKP